MNTLSYTGLNISFQKATERLRNIVNHTMLMHVENLSRKYQCNILLKREDQQIVRSYKLRGAYNMISCLKEKQLEKKLVCASAGNHAQGFAYSCKKLGVEGIVFMPFITPAQKLNQTRLFGENFIEIKLAGNNFDDCFDLAKQFAKENGMTFIPPFDDLRIIEGQATVASEILEDQREVDYLFVPVGGGGLAAGLGSYFKTYSPQTKIIGVEPEGAPAMYEALKAGKPVRLERIDCFVDGAAVKKVGDITFPICRDVLDDLYLVAEGKVCSTILKLFNEEGIVAEPAGALSVAALDEYAEEIRGKNVVCIISGGNNDAARMPEILERSVKYEEKAKHFFEIN